MAWRRYALYWVPTGKLGSLGARWLGRDMRGVREEQAPMVMAEDARRYGFHATLKAPFALADGTDEDDLRTEARALCAGLAPVSLGALQVQTLGGFLALRPDQPAGISAVGAALVRGLDRFRAPMTDADLARRRAAGLTARQDAHLCDWGYPYVFEDFMPHLTLSGRDADADLIAKAKAHFAPVLGRQIIMTHAALVGEDAERCFHLIEYFPLGHADT